MAVIIKLLGKRLTDISSWYFVLQVYTHDRILEMIRLYVACKQEGVITFYVWLVLLFCSRQLCLTSSKIELKKTAKLQINSFIIEFIFVARFNLHMWGLQKFDFGKEFSIYFTWINTQEYFVWTRKRCNSFLGNNLPDLLIILQTWGLKCMNKTIQNYGICKVVVA